MRPWLLLSGVLFAACATTPSGDPLDGTGDGKEDGYDSSAATKRENAVSAKFAAALNDSTALANLVAGLPKGGDLHMHLTGAAQIESLLGMGAGDHDCVSATYAAQACSLGGSPMPTSGSAAKPVIDAWSMQDNTTAAVTDRHTHFFATFGKFGFIARIHTADMLTDVRRTAAAENVQYLEVMISLGSGTGGDLGEKYLTKGAAWTATQFAAASKAILADPTLASTVSRNIADINSWEKAEDTALGCSGSNPEPACAVTVRYLVQGSRIATRESVFGQFVYGFALASAEPRVVGVNLVQAEDDPEAIKNYHDQMVGIGWVVDDATSRGAPVPISLHAGELTSAFAGAGDLAFHVREAVEIAGASRIGHATDLLGETDSTGLVQEMASMGVAVEACLTSNQQLLDVSGSAHPAKNLLDHGVPVAFATDDEGVLRIDMNDEITRAFTTQQMNYHEIKRAIRASMAHSFLPGTPIAKLSACHYSLLTEKLYSTCSKALATDERATAEWQLETALDAYEHSVLGQ